MLTVWISKFRQTKHKLLNNLQFSPQQCFWEYIDNSALYLDSFDISKQDGINKRSRQDKLYREQKVPKSLTVSHQILKGEEKRKSLRFQMKVVMDFPQI